jgi:hypothetical protein
MIIIDICYDDKKLIALTDNEIVFTNYLYKLNCNFRKLKKNEFNGEKLKQFHVVLDIH